MHDTLEYFKKDPYYRQFHHNDISFSLTYAFTENFMLPLSHDEVVHGKGPLMDRMPGDEWQRFANLRLLFGYMFTHPGTKILFMGCEIGQTSEWKHDFSVEWHLLDFEPHIGVQNFFKELNKVYKAEKALFEKAFDASGFEWIDYQDQKNSVLSYIRKGENEQDKLVVVCNFTPVPRENYRLGVFECKSFTEILNSDSKNFYGSGMITVQNPQVEKITSHWREYSVNLHLPPLSVIVLKPEF